MNQNIQWRTGKHPLARAREVLGIGQKQALEYLGIPEATCAHIESGRTNDGKPYRFTPKCVAHVSAWTGIAAACLLSKNPKVKLVTTGGEPFTEDTYARLASERDTVINPVRKSGHRTLWAFLILIARLGRALLAARADTDMQSLGKIIWQLHSEITKLGSTCPSWELKEFENGKPNRLWPGLFERDVSNLILSCRGKRLNLGKIGATILRDFDRQNAMIEVGTILASRHSLKRNPPRR
jgi:hypothetical protein